MLTKSLMLRKTREELDPQITQIKNKTCVFVVMPAATILTTWP
jgi:hypothetical protein